MNKSPLFNQNLNRQTEKQTDRKTDRQRNKTNKETIKAPRFIKIAKNGYNNIYHS